MAEPEQDVYVSSWSAAMATPREAVVARIVDVSVVLPCLNEELSVGLCVREALAALDDAGWSGEVVVVDNGCTDRSVQVATAAGARVVHEPTPGYGAALLRGIQAARGRVIVMADADCTYALDRLAEVARPVLEGELDLVVASRLAATTRQSMPLLHRFVGTPVLTWLVRAGTGTDQLSDSQSGFRAFDRGLASRLGLRATGMEFASEMLIRAAQRDISVGEVSLDYKVRVGESKLSTWRDGVRHLRLILRLSPHLLLWKPGLVTIAAGVVVYAASLAMSGGATVGSVTWQPYFFGTILVVFGLASALSGALLARHSPSAAPRTRASFAWVSDLSVVRRFRRVGVVLALAGIALDGCLFSLWISHTPFDVTGKLHLASLAQGLMLDGGLLASAMGVYLMVLAGHQAQPWDPPAQGRD